MQRAAAAVLRPLIAEIALVGDRMRRVARPHVVDDGLPDLCEIRGEPVHPEQDEQQPHGPDGIDPGGETQHVCTARRPWRRSDALPRQGDMASRFDAAYQGTPPWDIGRPQPEVVRLCGEGKFRGTILDAGCGTGENALFLASRGLEVWGVDFAAAAIERARDKARQRGLVEACTFVVLDALRLRTLARTFDVALDCGLFHVFDDGDRARYVASLADVVRPGGRVHLVCFSEEEISEGGPRRVTRTEIRDAFREGWDVRSIVPARFASHLHPQGARAWLTEIVRAG